MSQQLKIPSEYVTEEKEQGSMLFLGQRLGMKLGSRSTHLKYKVTVNGREKER